MKTIAIIVTYNPKKWIENCFSSLENSSIPIEIIVIDNGSTDGSQEIIKTNYPEVTFHQSNENLGFGQANNFGIKLAIENKADYFFLINQDAWVEKNTIQELIKSSIENPEFGILSPLHFNGNGTKLDFGFKNAIKNTNLNSENSLQEVTFVNAAIWLITKKCIEKVGGFNPVFFHYAEDNNYVSRLKYHNLKIGIVINLKAFHDRENRIENEFYENQYEVLKRDLTMTLSDPNLKIGIIKIFIATFLNLIKSCFFDKNNFKKNKLYLKAILNIDYQKIKHNKNISKFTLMSFLELEKNKF